MKRALRLFIIVPLFILCNTTRGQKDGLIEIQPVQTQYGRISGIMSADGTVKIFMGIPFAAPPIGDLRWKAPQPPEPWQGIRKCTIAPASALQSKPSPLHCWSKEFLIPEEPISEDCLYLNVWTAAGNNNEKRPVIVWIHGGAFTGGSGTVPLYNGEGMARKGVIFVTINYRLGILGFLAHPALSAESGKGVSGNYGILDQIAALQWVKNNIASFGGDPGNVTIAGQSAGAFSVNALMISPLAKGLFQRAIAQSGGMFGRRGASMQDMKNAEASGLKLEKQLGVNSIAEMRKIPAEKILAQSMRIGLTFDGVVIPSAEEVFTVSMQNDVPLLTGWNADDGVSFGPAGSAKAYIKDVKINYGKYSGEFLSLFPGDDDSMAAASQKLISQLYFGWQNYRWAGMESLHGRNKAFLYYFSHVPPGEPNYGAFHSAEFGYALATLKYWDRPFTDTDFELSGKMSSYWINFAKTGNPNGDGLPQWPAFSINSPEVMNFGDEVKAIPLPNRKQLELMNIINTTQSQN